MLRSAAQEQVKRKILTTQFVIKLHSLDRPSPIRCACHTTMPISRHQAIYAAKDQPVEVSLTFAVCFPPQVPTPNGKRDQRWWSTVSVPSVQCILAQEGQLLDHC